MALILPHFEGNTPLPPVLAGPGGVDPLPDFANDTGAFTPPINPDARLPELPAIPGVGVVGRVTDFIAREVVGSRGHGGNPSTAFGKTVRGIRDGGDGVGVFGAFGQEHASESRRLFGFDIGQVLALFVKWAPIVVIAWLAATLFAPAISRSVVSGVKGAVA